MMWTSIERRWRDDVLAATLPATATRPGVSAIEGRRFWPEYAARAPMLLKIGFRAAVWLVIFWSLLSRRRRFSRLEPIERDRILGGLARSRWYLVRQMTITLKLIACLAYFREPDIRQTLGGVQV